VKREPRKRPDHALRPRQFTWCGVAGVLGGVLFLAWGYVDRTSLPDTLRVVVNVLSFFVPALFLAAVVGLPAVCRSRLGVLGWTGMAFALYGSGWGAVAAILGSESVWVYFAQRGWPHFLADYLVFLLTGLTLLGIAPVRRKPSRGTGALALAMGASGWGYYLTDTRAVLEVRPLHVGLGLLFGLGWVALGVRLLLVARTGRPQSPTDARPVSETTGQGRP
jgi:hypothetical protein